MPDGHDSGPSAAYHARVFWFVSAILVLAGFILVVLIAGLVRRRLITGRQLHACQQFSAQRTALEQQFFQAASQSGKPRGLRWKECQFHGDSIFARDRANGELYALAGVTIAFEAIEGGEMEDVEAVGNLRCATAIFVNRSGRWTSEGRTAFNLEPAEALERYQESLEPLGPQDVVHQDE